MTRVEKILNNKSFLSFMEMNYEREKDRCFCSHNFQHAVDVARICYILILEDSGQDFLPACDSGIKKEIVYAAGLLHDIGRWQEYDSGVDHARVGAELAVKILEDCDFSREETGIITEAIYYHRSTAGEGSYFACCLRRADDLSRQCWKCRVRNECKKYSYMETCRGLVY